MRYMRNLPLVVLCLIMAMETIANPPSSIAMHRLGQQVMVTKTCSQCGGAVAVTSKVGDYCPHCGVRWGYEKTTSHRQRSNSSTPGQPPSIASTLSKAKSVSGILQRDAPDPTGLFPIAMNLDPGGFKPVLKFLPVSTLIVHHTDYDAQTYGKSHQGTFQPTFQVDFLNPSTLEPIYAFLDPTNHNAIFESLTLGPSIGAPLRLSEKVRGLWVKGNRGNVLVHVHIRIGNEERQGQIIDKVIDQTEVVEFYDGCTLYFANDPNDESRITIGTKAQASAH
jgi:hypothetical protein